MAATMHHNRPSLCPLGVHRLRRRGIGLIELLISLSISAMLLAAVGVAFSISGDTVNANDQFQRASQSARVSLHQILTEIRRCDDVEITSTSVEVLRPLSLRDEDELTRLYRYDTDTGMLLLRINKTDGTQSDEYVLTRNIASLEFGREMGVNSNNTACVARATMTLVIQVGNNHVGMSGSAAPRRSRRYLAS